MSVRQLRRIFREETVRATEAQAAAKKIDLQLHILYDAVSMSLTLTAR